jgi:hypothetical protein
MNYNETNEKIILLLNNLITSHKLELSDILNKTSDENSTSDQTSTTELRYRPINKNKDIKITNNNYNKLLDNNNILLTEILKKL